MELIVRLGERVERIGIERRGEGYFVTFGGIERPIDVVRGEGGLRSFLYEGRQFELDIRPVAHEAGSYAVSSRHGSRVVEVEDPLTHLAKKAGAGGGRKKSGRVTAYMPGRVVALLVAEGDEIAIGQPLAVLEAMKMQNEIAAEQAGVMKKVHVAKDQTVESGDLLFELE
jgi:glutaconyl-CoA/methylmalonyl-CoA decarboxylase subunit gamma